MLRPALTGDAFNPSTSAASSNAEAVEGSMLLMLLGLSIFHFADALVDESNPLSKNLGHPYMFGDVVQSHILPVFQFVHDCVVSE
jgi:hypothetical protein